MAQTTQLRAERDGRLAILTLRRPEAGNALDLELCRALATAAKALESDPGVGAVLIRAEGRSFCVGGDIAEFEAAGDGREALVREMAGALHEGLRSLAAAPAPVVVCVQGPAAGAGLGLAMAGDLIVAAKSAHFTMAYSAIGLSPDGGATWRLPRLVGSLRARELALTNRRLSADEALDWGLVTQVVADGEADTTARALAERLAGGPPLANAAMRRLLDAAETATFAAQLDHETDSIARLAGSADCAEGIAAFRGRRRAEFHGR